jgi:hypothetical protein
MARAGFLLAQWSFQIQRSAFVAYQEQPQSQSPLQVLIERIREGDPAKAADSEFSGSTAWEGAVRTRLYMGARLPGEEESDEPVDDSVRCLCRRKANYSTKDW